MSQAEIAEIILDSPDILSVYFGPIRIDGSRAVQITKTIDHGIRHPDGVRIYVSLRIGRLGLMTGFLDPDDWREVMLRLEDGRIAKLTKALSEVVKLIEETQKDTEGQWPQLDPNCIDCTEGAANVKPCAYHNALLVLHGDGK